MVLWVEARAIEETVVLVTGATDGLGRVQRQRLLAEDVLALLGGAQRPFAVQRVGQRQIHRVDRRVAQQFVVAAQGLREPRKLRTRGRQLRRIARRQRVDSPFALRPIAGITSSRAIRA